MCHIDPCPHPIPVYHRHHYRRRRRCPLVGWKKSFFSILARISAAAALPSVSLPPSLSCAHHLVVKEFEFADRPTDRPHAHAV